MIKDYLEAGFNKLLVRESVFQSPESMGLDINALSGSNLALLKVQLDKQLNIFNSWTELINTWFTYNSATVINANIPSATLTEVFQIGDKIKITQGGSDKYYYLTAIDAANHTITVKAGTDYTVANSTITYFAFSRFANPVGFPTVFNFDPGYRTPGVNQLAGAPSSESHLFWMHGRICYIDSHFDGDDLSGANSSIVGDLPVQPSSDYLTATNAPFYPCLGVNNFVIQTAGAQLSTSVNYDFEVLIIEYPGTGGTGFGTWGVSTNGVGLDISAMPYIV